MKRIERSSESLKYTIDFKHPPVVEVELGESFTVETEDAPSGLYRTLDDAAQLLGPWYWNYSPPMANPVTGPVHIKGVEPGDTLVVSVEAIDLDTQGATFWRPGHKPLGDSLKWSELSKPTLVIGRMQNGFVDMDEAATWEDGRVIRHRLGLRVHWHDRRGAGTRGRNSRLGPGQLGRKPGRSRHVSRHAGADSLLSPGRSSLRRGRTRLSG